MCKTEKTVNYGYSARQIATENLYINQIEEGNIRKCDVCGQYVWVDEYASEYITDKHTLYDICDYCIEKIESGIDINDIPCVEPLTYEDYIDEDVEDFDSFWEFEEDDEE